jgi:hypothetical protein
VLCAVVAVSLVDLSSAGVGNKGQPRLAQS